MLWHQGFDTAPQLVRDCLASWKHLNPNWNVVELNATNLHQYVDAFILERCTAVHTFVYATKPKCIPLGAENVQAFSDMVRTNLLSKHSGVWADATVMCLKPLEEWLPMNQEFFAYTKTREFGKISSWFLYAKKDSLFFTNFARRVYNSFQKDNYFWWHDAFYNYVHSNKDAQQVWLLSKKLSANLDTAEGPHVFTPYSRQNYERFNSFDVLQPILKDGTVIKLNHRDEYIISMPFYKTILDSIFKRVM